MTFTGAERAYLRSQELGRLATIGPSGAPHNHPVAFVVREGSIDIGGPDLARSRKFRNIQADPRVSFVVDDNAPEAVGPGGQRGRGVEVRGVAEIRAGVPLADGFTRDLLRIHPRRILAWNIDGPGPNFRDVRPARMPDAGG